MRNTARALGTCIGALVVLLLQARVATAETPPDSRFAILVGTGADHGGKRQVYDDLKFAYNTLISYGYLRQNIHVLSGAGCGQDGAPAGMVRYLYDTNTGSLIYYSCDLDDDGTDDIPPVSATKEHILGLLSDMKGILAPDDMLYFFITGDGGAVIDTISWYKSFGCSKEHIPYKLIEDTCVWDQALGDSINAIKTYAHMILHLRFCYSGDWIDNVSGSRRVVLTATDADQPANYTSPGSEHGYQFFSAMNGREMYPPTGGKDISAAVDIDPKDGLYSIFEGHTYTVKRETELKYPDNPQYWEAVPGLGKNLTLKGTVSNDVTPTDVVLVLDRSGSMASKDFQAEGNHDTRLDIVKKGAAYFAAAIDPTASNKVGVVSYNQASTNLLGLTDPGTGAAQISSALDAYVGSRALGMTSIGAGLNAAVSVLSAGEANKRRAIMLLTDGRQNTAPCLEANGSTGDCPGDPATNIKKDTFKNVPICSLGIARVAADVDEHVLEDFSDSFKNVQSSKDDLATAMAGFSKCASLVNGSHIAVDPNGILSADAVAAPAYTYNSAGDSMLTFLSSWSTTTDYVGDMHLLVNKPNGDLLLPTESINFSTTGDWDIQRDRSPAPGLWRFQVMRDNTRIVNGFTSNGFADQNKGVTLVRRQIQRLCPWGCSRVLYFEDGRVGGQPSAYQAALAAETASGLITTLTSYDESSAAAFDSDLAYGAYDLLIYVHQLSGNAAEPYDETLQSVLCSTDVRAIITDTRTPLTGSTSQALHLCSGAYAADATHANASTVSKLDATLLDENLTLVNRGYDVFSYSVGPVQPGLASALNGAVQLEGGNELATGMNVPDLGYIQFGSVVTASKDVEYYAELDCIPGSDETCDPPPSHARTRSLQRWASEVHFSGYAPIAPVRVPATLGAGLTLSVKSDEFAPPGGIRSATVWAEVVRPLVSVGDALSHYGCPGETNINGDLIYGSGVSISPDAIPTSTESYYLNDEGTDGDQTAKDQVWSVFVAGLGQQTGTYKIRYYAEFTYRDASGVDRTMHREGFATQYIGDEVLGGSTPCPAFDSCHDDSKAPVISPVQNRTVTSCDVVAGQIKLDAPSAIDNCVSPVVTGVVVASSSGAVGTPVTGGTVLLPVGTHTIRWTASDGKNTASVDQVVSVLPGLFAGQELQIGDRAVVGALVSSGSNTTRVGNDAATGEILSIANVTVGDRAVVNGSITSQAGIQLGFNVSLSGSTHPNASLSLPALPSLSEVTFPPATGNAAVNVNVSQTLPLSPGSYHTYNVNSGGTLVLSPGTYYFEQLSINAQATVRVDAAGALRIYVKDNLAVRSPIVGPLGHLTEVYLGYLGTTTVVLEAPLYATVLAPNASLEMGTGNAKTFQGTYMAKSLLVRPDITVSCVVPAEPTPGPSCSDGIKNQNETATDCGGICGATCKNGDACGTDNDCTSLHCVTGTCQAASTACSEANAIDLGAPGNVVTVATNGCVMVRDQYPSWWGTRTMSLQSTSPGSYPVSYTWSNSCAGASGGGSFTADWQSQLLTPTKSSCATLITLGGSGAGTIALRYYAN